MNEQATVKLKDTEIKVNIGTNLMEIIKDFNITLEKPILIALVNNEITDLNRKITGDCTVEFLDITSKNAYRAYQNSVAFLMITAAKEVLGKKTRIVVQHSIGKNFYCKVIDESITIDKKIIDQIEKKMKEKVEQKHKIEKILMPVVTAINISEETNLQDKVEILRYRRGSNVHMYKLDWFYNYFYGALVLECEKLSLFGIELYNGDIVIRFPDKEKNGELLEILEFKKILEVFEESSRWGRILGIDTVGNLNRKIIEGKFQKIVRISEALHEKKVANLADMILSQSKKLVLIAGPSSSGKTTFAHRLEIQLRVNGLKPHVISLDNYYLDRDKIPFGADGRQNFEVVEALDIEAINRDMEALLNGETVEIPSFNFVLGKKEYKGRFLKLEKDDVIVMEGIHGLNEVITKHIKKEDKFKIFISALTQLNVDDHNRIATTDTRLIRRIVRDNKFRGFLATTTIDIWPDVIKGEVENIFPYQNEADAVFNSALVYELSVLKTFVEPLLFDINPKSPEYGEAKRLVKFLENFLTVSTENIPSNSIIREFIGGGCFDL